MKNQDDVMQKLSPITKQHGLARIAKFLNLLEKTLNIDSLQETDLDLEFGYNENSGYLYAWDQNTSISYGIQDYAVFRKDTDFLHKIFFNEEDEEIIQVYDSKTEKWTA